MTGRRRNPRTAVGVVALLSLSVLPLLQNLTGSAEPPSLAAQSAQLLPPGTEVQEVALEGGGFLRAPRIDTTGSSVRLEGPAGTRELTGFAALSEPSGRRLWFGTDHLGRDLLARFARGARTSLTVAWIAAAIGGLLAAALGLATAGAPAWVEATIDWWTDGLLGLPRLLVLLVLGVAFGGGVAGIGLAIGLTSWMGMSRLIRAEVRRLTAQEFFAAARAGGAGPLRAAASHLLPHVGSILRVGLPLLATDAVLLEATLGFLGIPSGPDGDSWGAMIADGRRALPLGWWISAVPGVAIVATALAFHRISSLFAER